MRRIPIATLCMVVSAVVVVSNVGCRNQSGQSTDISAGPGSKSSGSIIPGVGYALPAKSGKYEVLGIQTDDVNSDRAKSNAESALTADPNIKCMVGLWAYNPPAILSALEARNKTGSVKIVAFDEHLLTLSGISAGTIHGTVVQQPYLFGFRSVEYLAALARKQDVKIPEDKMVFIPHVMIRANNVQEFNARIEAIKAGKGELPNVDRQYETAQKVKLLFITNNIDPFWNLAKEGVKRANPVFNADCDIIMPNGSVSEQSAEIDNFINNKGQGMAISPINAANQVEMLNKAANVMPVICQDSDAPTSNRRFYIGTNNYMAGRSAGKLVKEAIPDGGKVMLFVGKLEAQNAQDRSRGLIDELFDKPVPAAYQNIE